MKENFTGYNSTMKKRAQELRKNMTRQEKHLWYDFLKDYPLIINRQRSIGPYIVDFFCFKAKLVIELDGSQHYSDEGKEYDYERTKFLEEYGIKVIRFSNYDVDTNFEGVCMEIDKEIKGRVF